MVEGAAVKAERGAGSPPVRMLERLALVALLLLALVPRARELGAGFDRGFGGYQGAFFAIAAVNYERLGPGVSDGYPVLNVDLPGGSLQAARERPEPRRAYSTPPPPRAGGGGWAVRARGPEGWGDAWREDGPPRGIEGALRLPFLLFHMAGLLLLWWVARRAAGAQVAALALALVVFLPVSALYGTLVNYENPSLLFALLAVAGYAGYLRSGRRRELVLVGLGMLLGCSFTYGPLFFLPALGLHALWRRRARVAAQVVLLGGVSGLTPLLLHACAAGALRERTGSGEGPVLARARVLFEPLLDGSVPLGTWIGAQFEHMARAFGPVFLGALLLALAVAVARALSRTFDARCRAGELPLDEREPLDLGTPLFAAGLLYLFAFYRHTAEEQWVFLLYLVPGAALLVARAAHGISAPLLRLRGGIGPLVLLVGSVMLFSLARFETWRAAERAPGPRDVEGLELGPEAPLPRTAGGALAELLPPGAVGLHPEVLGLHTASAYYAWRSLLPTPGLPDPSLRGALDDVFRRLGLQDAPLHFVLPDDPPESTAPTVNAQRAALGAPTLTAAGWSAWLLD